MRKPYDSKSIKKDNVMQKELKKISRVKGRLSAISSKTEIKQDHSKRSKVDNFNLH